MECRRYGFDPCIEKIPWRRKWHPLQYSCLRNPMDRGEAWWAIVHEVTRAGHSLATKPLPWSSIIKTVCLTTSIYLTLNSVREKIVSVLFSFIAQLYHNVWHKRSHTIFFHKFLWKQSPLFIPWSTSRAYSKSVILRKHQAGGEDRNMRH